MCPKFAKRAGPQPPVCARGNGPSRTNRLAYDKVVIESFKIATSFAI